jgi:mycothiol synthase
MLWPGGPCTMPAIAVDYSLRLFRSGDEERYLDLMHRSELGSDWTRRHVDDLHRTIIPDGFFVIEHTPTGTLVATTIAQHTPIDPLPYSAQIGWVASDPDHRGKSLGAITTAAAVNRLVDAGWRDIYLLTDDWRLPAVATYLKLGFEPWLFEPGMDARWTALRAQLKHR